MTLTPPTNIAPATVAVVGPLAVTGPLTAAELLAAEPLAISAASLPLPTGAAKDSTLTDGTQRVGGTVAVTQSTSPWVVGDGGGSLSVDDNGGSLTVDGPLTNAQLLAAGLATEATLATLGTEATLEAVVAALAGLASDATLAEVREAVNDVALTAILEREKVE